MPRRICRHKNTKSMTCDDDREELTLTNNAIRIIGIMLQKTGRNETKKRKKSLEAVKPTLSMCTY